MAKTTRIVDIERVVHGNKVKTDFIAAPHTQIRNEQGQPRKIPDLANNLKPSFGVERILTYSIKLVPNEFGTNGNNVFENQNSDSRIRFVGRWENFTGTEGIRAQMTSADTTSYVEITFYGTGLNILTLLNTSVEDYRVSVDGGAEGANIVGGSYVPTITGRGYKCNQPVNAVKNLSLGIHTVKIRNATLSEQMIIHGFEILNESSQITVNSGQPFVGGKAAALNYQSLLDIKPSILTGTKGGRVVTYLDEEGNISQAAQAVDVTPQYITNTDHSNEEVVRRVNFREFGVNRADDFSTIANITSDRAFTLDDGTTTLVGDDIQTFVATYKGVGPAAIGNSLTLTFVGTGLDVIQENPNTVASTNTVSIDGVVVATDSTAFQVPQGSVIKICSGLPYGTHTIRIERTSASQGFLISDFIIYQSKKPTLPENAIEIADYNVVADFIANTTAGLNTISTGTIRKNSSREMVYSGAGWALAQSSVLYTNGFEGNINATGYVEYTFFGTGFDFRFATGSNRANNHIVEINTALLTAANFPTATFSTYGLGASFNDATGVLDQLDGAGEIGAGFVVSDLPLGLYTVKISRGATGYLVCESFDIITPIHINSSDLKTGSLSLADLRSNSEIENSAKNKIDLGRAKAWINYDASNGRILSSYNISAVVENTTVGELGFIVYFKHPFKNSNYVALPSGNNAATGNVFTTASRNTTGKSAVLTFNSGSTNVAPVGEHNVVFFGELEDEENIDLGDL